MSATGIIATVAIGWYIIGLVAAGVAIFLDWTEGKDIEGDDIVHAMFIALFGVFTLIIMVIGLWYEYVTPWLEDKLKDFRKKVFVKGRRQY